MVSKKTFYHYYLDLDNLLLEQMDEIMKGYLDLIRDYALPEDLEQQIHAFFRYAEQKGPVLERMMLSLPSNPIWQRVDAHSKDVTWKRSERFNRLSEFEQRLLIRSVSSTCLTAYQQWAEGGKVQPMEDVIRATVRLLCQGVDRFFDES